MALSYAHNEIEMRKYTHPLILLYCAGAVIALASDGSADISVKKVGRRIVRRSNRRLRGALNIFDGKFYSNPLYDIGPATLKVKGESKGGKALKSLKCKSSKSKSSSKSSKSTPYCAEFEGKPFTNAPTQQKTNSPTKRSSKSPSPTSASPTSNPTRACASQAGKENDIAQIVEDIGTTVLEGSPDEAAINWLTYADETNSCLDGGAALKDRLILALYYYRTEGVNWNKNGGWLSTNTTHCNWYGIECTDGNIASIIMDENNVNGEIPPEFSKLENLEQLRLYSNRLRGEIPTSLYSLPNLLFVDFEENRLRGK